jgi:hypothetical protein
MKKNAMLKIAAILMVAVLLTTCAISSTFAKYTTGDKSGSTNKGEVAKWGLKLAVADNVALFKDEYENALSATLTDEKFIMAPGTSNTADLGFSIQGTPEVAFQVTFDPKVDVAGFMIDSTFYCPVKFWVNDSNKTPAKAIEITYDNGYDTSALEDAIADAIFGTDVTADQSGVFTKKYEPNATAFATAKTVSITWDWAFDGNHTNDTALGDQAAEGTENSIEISYTITAEQIKTVA